MPLYTRLPDEVETVDIIVAGGTGGPNRSVSQLILV